MPLHQDETDGFIDVTAGEDHQEGRLEPQAGDAHAGQHQQVHEQDLQHGAGGGIAGGAVGVVLHPVAHADHRGHAVDQQHTEADAEGFAG